MSANQSESRHAWVPYLVGGVLLIVLGEIFIGAAHSASAGVVQQTSIGPVTTPNRSMEVFGGIVVAIGGVVALVGVVALGVTVALTGLGLAAMPVRNIPGLRAPVLLPAQNDPSELPLDPDPFAPHAGDSTVVADVRRACGSGARDYAVRRIINKAERSGQLSDADRAMVDGLLTESTRRPLGPLRYDTHS
jgi:hypothetical protein